MGLQWCVTNLYLAKTLQICDQQWKFTSTGEVLQSKKDSRNCVVNGLVRQWMVWSRTNRSMWQKQLHIEEVFLTFLIYNGQRGFMRALRSPPGK